MMGEEKKIHNGVRILIKNRIIFRERNWVIGNRLGLEKRNEEKKEKNENGISPNTK